jgi:hypothetical protein
MVRMETQHVPCEVATEFLNTIFYLIFHMNIYTVVALSKMSTIINRRNTVILDWSAVGAQIYFRCFSSYIGAFGGLIPRGGLPNVLYIHETES